MTDHLDTRRELRAGHDPGLALDYPEYPGALIFLSPTVKLPSSCLIH